MWRDEREGSGSGCGGTALHDKQEIEFRDAFGGLDHSSLNIATRALTPVVSLSWRLDLKAS